MNKIMNCLLLNICFCVYATGLGMKLGLAAAALATLGVIVGIAAAVVRYLGQKTAKNIE